MFGCLVQFLVGVGIYICFFVGSICLAIMIISLLVKKKRNKAAEKIFGICLLLFVLLTGFLLLIMRPNHPSDGELIENYEKNKAGFDGLVRKIQEDKGIQRIGSNWTLPEDTESVGITKHELKEYRKTFKQLDIPSGFCNYGKNGILFIASTYGLSISGSTKGYFYSESRNI